MADNKTITKKTRILACEGNVNAKSTAKMCNASLAEVHNIWSKAFTDNIRQNERIRNWKHDKE